MSMKDCTMNHSELKESLWELARCPSRAALEVRRRMELGATLEQARAEVARMFERTDCTPPADGVQTCALPICARRAAGGAVPGAGQKGRCSGCSMAPKTSPPTDEQQARSSGADGGVERRIPHACTPQDKTRQDEKTDREEDLLLPPADPPLLSKGA